MIMTDRIHDRNRLLYWKKIIREAEAYEGTNIDWMRKHGITEGSYYYWHRILRKEGMLNREDEPELKDIPLPGLVAEPTEASQGSVEYTPQNSSPEPLAETSWIQERFSNPQLMLLKNGIQIYVGNGFHEDTLSRLLEVVSHVK